MRRILLKIFKICGPIAVYICIWQLLSMSVGSSLLLPSPKETFEAMVRIIRSKMGWVAISATLLRIVIGYVCGCIAGVLLAVLTAHSRVCDWLLKPLRSLIKTTPITSFALILLVSVVKGTLPIVVAMIVVIPMIWQTTEEAIKSRSKQLDEMSRIYLTFWKKLRYVTLPQVLPRFLATASTALGFAWKAVITAEILAVPKKSIGLQMYNNKMYLETPELIAWTLIVIILSVIIESCLKFGLKKAGQKYD